MSVTHELAAHLATSGCGVVGTTIFRGTLPDTPDVCIALREYGGLAPVPGFGSTDLVYETPAVQVLVRGAADDYDGPRDRAELAYRALAAVQALTLASSDTTAFYHWVAPQQGPFEFTRDQRKRVVFAFNCVCEKGLSA